MEFIGVQNKRILDDALFLGLQELMHPETLHDEINKIQAVKQHQRDAIKRPDDAQHTVRAYYYAMPVKSKNLSYYHLYAPAGINIIKVPQSMLGYAVLGTANLKTQVIHILETLDGCAFEEVKRHELNHLKYPYLSEWDIRQKTRAELPFYPLFH